MSKNYTFTIKNSMAKALGIDSTLVLQQIQFWTIHCGKKIKNEKGLWIYNSLEEWHKQFSFWSLSKLRRIIKSLEKQRLVISKKINSKKWNQTKWYSINLNEYSKLVDADNLSDKKRTDRFVQNEQMLLKKTKNNYTNKSSYREEKSLLKNNQVKKRQSNYSQTKNTENFQEQKNIAKQMVVVWNEQFECSLNPVRAFVNNNIIEHLYNILETKFANDLEKWKLYAQAVSSSKFLMGEKETKSNFKAQFLWLIKEETIDSIQSGAYGVGDRVLDSDRIDENLQVCQKEVQQIVQDKLVVQIQDKTSNEAEEQEFKKYLINREYERDGDKYMLRKHMDTIGSQYMYGGYITPSHVFYSGNEKYKKRLFQSYLLKKYYGIDETGISTSFDRSIKVEDGKSMLLKFKSIREKLKCGLLQNSYRTDGLFGGSAEKIKGISLVCMLN